jgi:hypothetical protein
VRALAVGNWRGAGGGIQLQHGRLPIHSQCHMRTTRSPPANPPVPPEPPARLRCAPRGLQLVVARWIPDSASASTERPFCSFAAGAGVFFSEPRDPLRHSFSSFLKKNYFASLNNSLCPLNLLNKFRLKLLPQTILMVESTRNEISLFYFSTYKWNFNFKLCKATYNMMLYARKIYYNFFMNIFHAELYFFDKFHVKYLQIMKIIMKFF